MKKRLFKAFPYKLYRLLCRRRGGHCPYALWKKQARAGGRMGFSSLRGG